MSYDALTIFSFIRLSDITVHVVKPVCVYPPVDVKIVPPTSKL